MERGPRVSLEGERPRLRSARLRGTTPGAYRRSNAGRCRARRRLGGRITSCHSTSQGDKTAFAGEACARDVSQAHDKRLSSPTVPATVTTPTDVGCRSRTQNRRTPAKTLAHKRPRALVLGLRSRRSQVETHTARTTRGVRYEGACRRPQRESCQARIKRANLHTACSGRPLSFYFFVRARFARRSHSSLSNLLRRV
jgi:hypothetical protein